MDQLKNRDSVDRLAQPPPVPNWSPEPQRPRKGLMRTAAIVLLTLMLAVVFGTGLFAGWQFGTSNRTNTSVLQPGTNTTADPAPSNTGDIGATREAVAAKVRPAVVQINAVTAQGRGVGSGVIIDQRGYIVTNNHVVQQANQLQVMLSNGSRLPAQLVGASAPDDLAVLKVTTNEKLTVAALGDSTKLRVGQEVLAIGNPLGITQTVTSGIVSALGREVGTIPDAIQTDAAINPGNSGGALVDLQGRIIGIPTATAIDPQFKTPANGVGFAVPSNRVDFITSQIIETGKVTSSGRAIIGVGVVSVDPILAAQENLASDHGALIAEVTKGGPADRAGLRPADIIVQLDNKEVRDITSLSDILLNEKPGDTVPVQVKRGNQLVSINVQLGELQVG
jgi:S1-C subfamily serine protease